MSRASTPTKLSLYRWAQLVGIHPLHFCGVTVAGLADQLDCSAPWLQYSWLDSARVSREDVAEAIAQAELDLETWLHFRLLPTWELDEWKPTDRPYHPEFFNIGNIDIRGYRDAIKADWGYFLTGGIRAVTALSLGAAIVWTDGDGDGYTETGTVTFATALTDEEEIRTYYPGKIAADEWEIRPTSVTIAAGTCTVTFRRELAVLETLQESLNSTGVDGLDDANFLDVVDVYRYWNDPQTQATLMWEPTGTCGCGTCILCQQTVQTGCLHSRNEPRLSLLAYTAGDWNATTEEFDAAGLAVSRSPDIVKLYYRAGFEGKKLAYPKKLMARNWERAVAYYAASLLERPVCDCPNAHRTIEQFQQDLGFSGGAEELASYNLTEEDLGNPLGTRRGALFAWKRIKNEAIGEAVVT